MDYYPHQAGANDQHVDWNGYPTPEAIPDDLIDPALLGEGEQSNSTANQTIAHRQRPQYPSQQPHQLPAQSIESSGVEQAGVYEHEPSQWQQYNSQPSHHLPSTSHHQDGGTYQHQLVANPSFDPQASSQILSAFSTPLNLPTHPPTWDASVHQQQPWIPQPYQQIGSAYPQSPPPQDGRIFFRQAAVAPMANPSPHVNRPLKTRGKASVSSLPKTPRRRQNASVAPNVQQASPTKNQPRSFSRGIGQGPIEVDNYSPFKFQSEPDSSPLTSLAATPALTEAAVTLPSGQENTEMRMDLSDWDSGREARVGLPSSSPPRVQASNSNMPGDATPRYTGTTQAAVASQTEGLDMLVANALAAEAAGIDTGHHVDDANGTINNSGPQTGESSLHGQHLNSQATGIVPDNVQPVISEDERAASSAEMIRENERQLAVAMAEADRLRHIIEQQKQQQQQQQGHVLTSTKTLPEPFNEIQFKPAVAPAITSPLMISPYPPRIPGTFTPAILSLTINPPPNLKIGNAMSVQVRLQRYGVTPYNDIYPRTYPVACEPSNRTVVVEARYLSVIGLLYPRAEFIVARVAEEAENAMNEIIGNRNCHNKIDPNSAMIMERFHMYPATRLTGQEMQKFGGLMCSMKGTDEWAPKKKKEEKDQEAKRRRTEVFVVDEEEEGEYDSDATLVPAGNDEAVEQADKENIMPSIEQDEEGDVAQSNNGKGKAKDGTDKKDKGKAPMVLQERDSNDNAAAPSMPNASASASTPVRRSARVQSRQASAASETPDRDDGNDDRTRASKQAIRASIATMTSVIRFDKPGESSSSATATVSSRPIKTPKPRIRLRITKSATTTGTEPVPSIPPTAGNPIPDPVPAPEPSRPARPSRRNLTNPPNHTPTPPTTALPTTTTKPPPYSSSP